MANNQAQANAKATQAKSPVLRPIRYRFASIFLLVLYIAILLIPWVITCILMSRPVDASSYYNQVYGLSVKVINSAHNGWYAIEFFSQIQVVLAIPIVSGLLAQAATVYTQHVISWLRYFSRSAFIAFGGLLILLVAITPAIQSVLVEIESIRVVDCREAPINACSFWNVPSAVGLDPSPSDLEHAPQNMVVQHVAKKLQQVSDDDEQPYMWPDSPLLSTEEPNNEMRSTFTWYTGYTPGTRNGKTYFVSSLKNGSNTGILREHAMRFNSSVNCETTPASDFPPGDQPYVTNLSAPEIFDLRICVPGAYGRTRWNLTRDRQDITEELWVDVAVHDEYMMYEYTNKYGTASYTQHCTARSTRGYFEVNNDHNGGQPGPLLDKWPSPEESATEYNDFLGLGQHYGIPSASGDNDPSADTLETMKSPPDPFNDDYYVYAPGPLMTGALALFGNLSFFHAVSQVNNDTAPLMLNILCQLDVIPFTQVSFSLSESLRAGSTGAICEYHKYQSLIKYQNDNEGYVYQSLISTAFDLVAILNDTSFGTTPLSMAMYFAHEGLLTSTASGSNGFGDSRRIYYSGGAVLTKPKWSLGCCSSRFLF